MDDLINTFCEQFNFLIVVRLLNSFKSQSHTRAAWHVVSFMNHHPHSFLKAGKSKTDKLKSFISMP